MSQMQAATAGSLQPGTSLGPQQSLAGGRSSQSRPQRLTACFAQSASYSIAQQNGSPAQTHASTVSSAQPPEPLGVQQSLLGPAPASFPVPASASARAPDASVTSGSATLPSLGRCSLGSSPDAQAASPKHQTIDFPIEPQRIKCCRVKITLELSLYAANAPGQEQCR
jgi:hypothetical protein